MQRIFFGLTLSLLIGWGWLPAQSSQRIDTLYSAVPQTHQYLHLRVPLGELYMRSSEECGLSIVRLLAPDSAVRHQIQQHIDEDGNHRRFLALTSPGLTAKGANLRTDAGATLHFGADLSTLDRYGAPESFRSEFNPDPNLSTDLHLDLGVGASRLDFSGLSLRNVQVRSAFADVMIDYRAPNQIAMDEMDLHVTKGDIILKQPELARARLISIQNDMGDTKILLGDTQLPQTRITIHAGMGSCTLIVDAQHPTKVVIKGNLFSDQEVSGSFEAQAGQVFVNEAYQTHCEHNGKGCPHATHIVCNLDLGSIAVMEKP